MTSLALEFSGMVKKNVLRAVSKFTGTDNVEEDFPLDKFIWESVRHELIVSYLYFIPDDVMPKKVKDCINIVRGFNPQGP